MADKQKTPVARESAGAVSSATDVDDFLAVVRAKGAVRDQNARGRLIFAMDATMSRQPTWDRACALQGEMFQQTATIGGLSVQLVYFRGFGECRSSKWVGDARGLAGLMSSVQCRGGHTQIGKVLAHARREHEKRPVGAVVYVGDCMEENIDTLCAQAGELGLLGVPFFMFQEGREPMAERAFREIVRLTNGAYCRFDAASADRLRELLAAVAVYAAGGVAALSDLSRGGAGEASALLEQLK